MNRIAVFGKEGMRGLPRYVLQSIWW